MHVPLTDRLTCPRCGPAFGLILLADRVEERRVHEGELGCPNCRDRFPVRGGFADLRAPPRTPLEGEGEAELHGGDARDEEDPDRDHRDDPDATLKLAALLGVREGPGNLVLAGAPAARAAALADLLEEVEVVAVAPLALAGPERPGVSRMVARPGLPFRSRSVRGVALGGEAIERFLEEAARVVQPGGRVVVLGVEATGPVRARLESAGLSIVLDQEGAVVAGRNR